MSPQESIAKWQAGQGVGALRVKLSVALDVKIIHFAFETLKQMSHQSGGMSDRGRFAFSMKDIVWLSFISLIGLGWYAHSFVMCPECAETAAGYAEIRAENDKHAKDWEINRARVQARIEELKQECQEALVATVRVRSEMRRLEQLEKQLMKQQTQDD